MAAIVHETAHGRVRRGGCLSQGGGATGHEKGHHSLLADPLFTSPKAGNWALRPTSPAAEPAAKAEAKDADGIWLTVSRAAELLKDDVPWLDTKKARARISAAATCEEIKTNGKMRRQRRLDQNSFSSSRLMLRDRDLDAEG